MNEFTFDPMYSPWELALGQLRSGDSLNARRFLALVEASEDLSAEDAAMELEQRGVILDVSDLPWIAGNPDTQARLDLEKKLLEQGTLMENLEAHDPLRLFLEETDSLEKLEDGSDLAMAMAVAAGDESAMQELTNGYLACVLECAKEYAGSGVLLMDLIQEGSLGLWQGILSYETGDFRPHAIWWIRQAMARVVTLQAQANGVGQNLSQQIDLYQKTDRKLLTQFRRNPTELEIAQEMGITLEESTTLGKMLREIQTMAKLKKTQTEQEQTEEDDQAVEDTAYYQQRQRIDDMLTGLTDVETKLIRMRYGLDGQLPMTAVQVAQQLSMSLDEVAAVEMAALSKMRQKSE